MTDPRTGAIRVLVVDDQRVVGEGLSMLLGLIDGLEVVGAAGDGEEALAMVAGTDPDVVLMDLNMPRLDGTEATRRLSRSHPHLPVVVLTTYTDDQQVFSASPRTPRPGASRRAPRTGPPPTGSPGGRSTSCGTSPPGTPTPRSPPPCSCPRRP
jgi:CheY-like chemotaxis protein